MIWAVLLAARAARAGRRTECSRLRGPACARGREELPRGGEELPTSKVRGSSLECQAATAQERPRGATPHPRLGAMARRRYPHLKPGAGAGRSHPLPRPGPAARRSNTGSVAQEGLEELSHTEGQEQRR